MILIPMSGSHIILPNFVKNPIKGIGNIRLTKDIFLHNVMYNPTFRFNLLSLVILLKADHFWFILEPNIFFCRISTP